MVFHLHPHTLFKPHKEKGENETLSGPHKNGLFTSESMRKKKDKSKKSTKSIDFVMIISKPPN